MCPQFNGIGPMSSNFGSGGNPELSALIQTNPSIFYDAILSTLTTRNIGQNESLFSDYIYYGRDTITYPTHDAISNGNTPNHPTYAQLTNGSPAVSFALNQSLQIQTAFGASTSHTFAFLYQPVDVNIGTEQLISLYTPAQMLIYTKINNTNRLGVFDGAFRNLGVLQAGIHSYVMTLDSGTVSTKSYIDRNPVAQGTDGYTPASMLTLQFFGAALPQGTGLNGLISNFMYWNRVITANEIAAYGAYTHKTYGSA